MCKAYQDRYDVVTNFRNGLKDASSGWHSIDFYKDYIAYLETEAEKVGIPISGLMMYYVAYPEDVKYGKYSGYQTYIYVPTYYKKGSHIAFDPLHIGDDGVPLPIHDIIVNGDKGKYGSLNAGKIADGGISSIANMGEMCEPNCASDVVAESN